MVTHIFEWRVENVNVESQSLLVFKKKAWGVYSGYAEVSFIRQTVFLALQAKHFYCRQTVYWTEMLTDKCRWTVGFPSVANVTGAFFFSVTLIWHLGLCFIIVLYFRKFRFMLCKMHTLSRFLQLVLVLIQCLQARNNHNYFLVEILKNKWQTMTRQWFSTHESWPMLTLW